MAVGKKSKLTRVFFLALIAGVTLSFVLLGYLWITWEYKRFHRKSAQMRSEFMLTQKDRIRGEVDNVIEFIEFKKSQTEMRLKRNLRDRTDEAWKIAMNIYDSNRLSKTDIEIKAMIKDALRPIRFNHGRGYFFAVSMDGVEQLYPVRPDLEGQNLFDLQDAKGTYVIRHEILVIRESGEGFVTNYWPKPNRNPAEAFPKISFVKYVAPLDWYIGAGEYLDDVEKDIQKEVLEWINTIKIGREGYIFAGQWDGLSLSGPVVGKNMIDVTDVNGVKVVKKLIGAARDGSGFVHYVMPELEGRRSAPKISFAAGIPDWQWYVGAGVYIDEIDRIIADQKNILESQVKHEVLKIVLVMIILLIMVSVAARFFFSKIEKSLSALTVFFEKAAGESTRINPEDLAFTEFSSLAEAANSMVDQRRQAEKALRESREQWRAIVDNAHLGIYQVTTEGKFIFANPRMAKILGYESPEELIAQVSDVSRLYVNPEDRQQNLEDFLTRGFITDRRLKFRRKDGQVIWIQASARIVDDRSEQRIIEGFILDITERVAFETALKESEERYRSLVEMSPETVFLHQKGKFIYTNQQGARLLGAADPRQITGKPILDFIHPDYREVVQKRVNAIYFEKNRCRAWSRSTFDSMGW